MHSSSFNSRTNSLGNQSGTFEISNVQLEFGPVATDFEYVDLGTQLKRCQRYYMKSDGEERDSVFAHYGSNDRYAFIRYPSELGRATSTANVTLTVNSMFEDNANITGTITSSGISAAKKSGFAANVFNSNTGNAGGAALVYLEWEVDEEL